MYNYMRAKISEPSKSCFTKLISGRNFTSKGGTVQVLLKGLGKGLGKGLDKENYYGSIV